MKNIALLFILLFCKISFSQSLTKSNIYSFSLDHIFDELITTDKYTTQICGEFGESLAKNDYGKGERRILRYTGMFTNTCMTCLYYKVGYTSYDFAPNDIYWDNVDSFVEAYNKSMLSHLPKEVQDELNRSKNHNEVIFSLHLTTLVTPNIKTLTDSTLNFRLQSDTLEFLFKENIDSLKIIVNYQIKGTDSDKHSYQEMKNYGITIKDNKQDKMRLYLTLDFEDMPANYDICWCPAVEPKYRLILPISLK